MGMEIPLTVDSKQEEMERLQNRPSILLVGPHNVGKRSILKRLVSRGASKNSFRTSVGVSYHGWTIDTKYYAVDVCIWVAPLGDSEVDDNLRACALGGQCEALVMVFDLSDFTSFETLQKWASEVELQKFEILLCVGNKADCVPDHYGHIEYRRKVQKQGESSSDPHPEFWDYGIQQSEGSSLLFDENESLQERRRSCIEWCIDNGIEYVESCAIDEYFDKCMSVNGDSQGLDRIWEALAAHMWSGMVMKPQNKFSDAHPPPKAEELESDDDSEFSIEYELLSNDSEDPWNDEEGPWSFSSENIPVEIPVSNGLHQLEGTSRNGTKLQEEMVLCQDNGCSPPWSNSGFSAYAELGGHCQDHKDTAVDIASTSERIKESIYCHEDTASSRERVVVNRTETEEHTEREFCSIDGLDQSIHSHENSTSSIERTADNTTQEYTEEHSVDDLEQLMHEVARMRENLGLMPDSCRREMAARLAMQMVSMFREDGDDSDAE
eukprot:c26415_g1_i1 orf=302-1783(+)